MSIPTILILLVALVVIWVVIHLVMRLTAKLFGCGCLGIAAIGVVLLIAKVLKVV